MYIYNSSSQQFYVEELTPTQELLIKLETAYYLPPIYFRTNNSKTILATLEECANFITGASFPGLNEPIDLSDSDTSIVDNIRKLFPDIDTPSEPISTRTLSIDVDNCVQTILNGDIVFIVQNSSCMHQVYIVYKPDELDLENLMNAITAVVHIKLANYASYADLFIIIDDKVEKIVKENIRWPKPTPVCL